MATRRSPLAAKRKALGNHHGRPSEHAKGDPLGVYMPPLTKWKKVGVDKFGMKSVEWTHPTLGWKFDIAWAAVRNTRAGINSTAVASVDVKQSANGSQWRSRDSLFPENAMPGMVDWKNQHWLSNVVRGPRAAYKEVRDWYSSLRPSDLVHVNDPEVKRSFARWSR